MADYRYCVTCRYYVACGGDSTGRVRYFDDDWNCWKPVAK